MAVGFTVKIDASRINLKLERMPAEVRDALTAVVFVDAGLVARAAQERAPLKTGKFARSIKPRITVRENSVTGRVSTHDPRANLFEWGGKTGAHDILPNKAKALLIAGNKFASIVHHPGGKYAALNIVHGALEGMAGQIETDLEDAVKNAAERASE
jgi:hypothetical protein